MTPYDNLDRLFVAGEWRKGTGDALTNVCPWDESTIFEMPGATPRTSTTLSTRPRRRKRNGQSSLPPPARPRCTRSPTS